MSELSGFNSHYYQQLRSEKVQGYYKLADGEQWIQTGHGKIAQKIPQKKESKL